ncbi:MAG: hypothetical protein AAGH99_13195 [Planctomycetota bacterium]
MSSPEAYYVRLARSVEGPLSRQELLHKAQLNLFSTFHEVSSDRQHWEPLSPALLEKINVSATPESAAEEAGEGADSADELAWLDALERPADQAGEADIAAYGSASASSGAASWFRNTALSAGLLIVAVASLPIPRQDGASGGWWHFSGPWGWTLGVWFLVGLMGLAVALLPARHPRGRVLLGAAAGGWVGGLVLLLESGALGAVVSACAALLPIVAWCVSCSIAGHVDPQLRRSLKNVCPPAAMVWMAVGVAWCVGVVFTLFDDALPLWWIMVTTAVCIPAGLIALSSRGDDRTDSSLQVLLPNLALAIGLLLASAVLGIVQNLGQPGDYHLVQLVTAAVGMIAVGGVAVAAGLDLWTDA